MNQIRDTFGIIDPETGKQYKDVLSAFIKLEVIASSKLQFNSTITDSRQNVYLLRMDSKTRKELKEAKVIQVIVSYQKRTDGNYAMARIYEPNEGKEGELK